MSDVYHCPYCELRFVSRNEVQDHMAVDHPRAVDDDTTGDATPPATPR